MTAPLTPAFWTALHSQLAAAVSPPPCVGDDGGDAQADRIDAMSDAEYAEYMYWRRRYSCILTPAEQPAAEDLRNALCIIGPLEDSMVREALQRLIGSALAKIEGRTGDAA